jgi:2-keto-4-pentenoate hydratase/2-oxohepta-3-ene-1,7-dioic acid hydratase in catechol pathway
MKVVKLESAGRFAEGILEKNIVHLVGGWLEGSARDTIFSLPRYSSAELQQLLTNSTERVPLAAVKLAVPFDSRRKIIGVGLNYPDHATETKNEAPANPMLFTRSLDSLAAHEEPILRPRVSTHFDFEGEIAVVIGREGRHVSIDNAPSYVFGYCCFMDGSVRDYQKHTLTTGKNFWRSGSMGPWIVTQDEVADADLKLETRLNGETVQSAHLHELIFSVARLIEYCSRWTVLQPGDVIATGTPAGVGSRRTPPLWMKPGDVLEVEVEKLGCLRNPVVAE